MEDNEHNKHEKMAEATKKNSYRFDNLSPEIRAQYHAKSVETRRQRAKLKKSMQLLTLEILENGILNKKARETLEQFGISGDDATYQAAIIVAQLNKALKGDTQAFIVLRDTSGQKPVEQVQHIEPPKIVDDVLDMIEDSEEAIAIDYNPVEEIDDE